MPSRLVPGDGHLVVSLDNQKRAVAEQVDFSYPLKLMVPSRRFLPHLQAVYVIGYGGGLVAGDRVRLKVDVKEGTTLVMLTQGSTKVFKTRPERYLHAPSSLPPTSALTSTLQLYRLSVAPASFLILLPAPVTCFSRSRYSQRQVVHLADETSSLVLLDWYTAGRVGMDDKNKGKGAESWEFERYRSENEVWLGPRRLAKDVLLLEDEGTPPVADSDETRSPLDALHDTSMPSTAATAPTYETTYSPRVSPYSCYATLFLFGSHTASIITALQNAFTAVTHFKQPRPYSLVWSFSTLPGHPGGGGVARCAGAEAEQVREWVTHVLNEGGMGEMISHDLWKTAFS
ncbi:hypothetical protein JCM11251_000538 [Rhodosporidiobolus azoricus]